MSRNNIIGLLIILGMMVGYSIWMSPSKEEIAAAKRKADSITRVRNADSIAYVITELNKKKVADSLAKINPPVVPVAKKDSVESAFTAPVIENKFYTLESDLLKVKISAIGGRIWSIQLKDFRTYDTLPLILFEGDSNQFGFEFNTEDLKLVNTNNLVFAPEKQDSKDSIRVSGSDSIRFALRLYPNSADSSGKSYIEYVYTLSGNSYMLGFTVNFAGMKGVIANNARDMSLVWNNDLKHLEKSYKTELSQSTIYYKDGEDVNYLTETKDMKERVTTAVDWVSFKQQFFSATLIAPQKFLSADLETMSYQASSTNRLLKRYHSAFVLPFNESGNQTYDLKWYFGPNKYKLLRKYKIGLERQIPLGWGFFLMHWINRFAVIPVFNWLEGWSINYGIIILILTILLKIVLFPIAWKTYISSAKMRILKPEIEEINARYPKKEEAMKKQQATMALYKRAGVNPMAGCVPMLLQFPILIAMFRFFPSAFELRQQPFLWAHDLSSYDSIWNLPFTIPFYGDHVSLFTLLMTISTIIYTKINNDMMGSTNQLPGMKTMMYLMPIMFLGFFNDYSSGLSYYYLLANLLTFAQMYIIRRFVDEDKLHKRIQENKAKPVKKSSWQKRLEEATRQHTSRKK